jgi:uncharacterized LabA/DUF88 family protein
VAGGDPGRLRRNEVKSRLLVFVDESNVTGAARIKNKNLDWLRLRGEIVASVEDSALVEMVVYVGLPPSTEELKDKRESKEKYVHWLRNNGFLVVTKEGSPKEGWGYKSNVDVLMAMDAVELSLNITPDIVVLVTGDGDFSHLALKLRRRGIRVSVCSIRESLSSLLKDSVNSVIPLEDSSTVWMISGPSKTPGGPTGKAAGYGGSGRAAAPHRSPPSRPRP